MARTPDPTKPARARKPRPAAAASSLGAPARGTGSANIFTSKPVPIGIAGPEHRYVRADLEILGLYHGEASYEGRIFFNNPQADHDTPRDVAHGYAGSFYVFGHGGCLGDPGHCEINEHTRDAYDFRAPHPLTPAMKRVTVTTALREVAKTTQSVTVTVVPIVSAANELCDTRNVFRCADMRFLTYNA